ncbi:MAG: PIN domain-containing protein, partial [Burkholderiaceae bacterium]
MPLPKPPIRKATLLATADYPTAAKRPKTTDPDIPLRRAEVPVLTATPTAAVSTAQVHPIGRATPGGTTKPPAATAASKPKLDKPKAGKPSKGLPTPVATKLFVLDTNVLMHDPMSIFRFEEHDVFLPMITLEELDGHKKGMSEVSRNVRQVSRELDALAADGLPDPAQGIPLAKTGHREASGRLFFQTTFMDTRLPEGLPQGKADNQILGVVQALRGQIKDREVVLVSKDINMRIKARALGLPA